MREYTKNCVMRAFFSIIALFSFFSQVSSEKRAWAGVQSSVCASVKIEIKQEITLERQAFDAHMRINNGLSNISLEDVRVDVLFTDEEGEAVCASSVSDDQEAIFFIRIDSLENIDDVDGLGTVAPSTSADIHWLIIPAPQASNGLESGKLYYVGARLSYRIGGEENITEVTPDYIFVKPMPELTIDYFLPNEVFGDDAWTEVIEPPEPFFLGLRVSNNGGGVARNFRVDSAQPKIVENEQGLLVGFVIEGSQVDEQPVAESLLVDLGDIPPELSKTARWKMTCSLSGKFFDFSAVFSHSDELGGELTSLIQDANTHFLLRNVLVDVPGRDRVRDFLALDDDVIRLYESDTIDTVVLDQSTLSDLSPDSQTGQEIRYSLTTSPGSGFIYVQLLDPFFGNKIIYEVLRSDGKRIKLDNCWLSKTRGPDHTWAYHFNLFDSNTTGHYMIVFVEPGYGSSPPVLELISDRTGVEGRQLIFDVIAVDSDNTVPLLSATPLPAGAIFTDHGDGTGRFQWQPAIGQAGRYVLLFKASDGNLEDMHRVELTINSIDDTDGDGMPDAWEMAHFGFLDRDGTEDYDNDGIPDLEEYLNGDDPIASNAPAAPRILSPVNGDETLLTAPELTVENSLDPDGDAISYHFELFADDGLTVLLAAEQDVPEGQTSTAWISPQSLDDNSWYFWRVRATDGKGFSEWTYGSFFVNTLNDSPRAFNISRPSDQIEVDTLRPVLEVTNSNDVDEDVLVYRFEIYADPLLNHSVIFSGNIPEGDLGNTFWQVDSDLADNCWHYWRCLAIDEHGAQTETLSSSFFVNTANDAPTSPVAISPEAEEEITAFNILLEVGNSSDPDGDSLVYYFEVDTVSTFDSSDKRISIKIPEGVATTYWEISGFMDNTPYFWRVKASDGFSESPWIVERFFVNTENDSPSVPTLVNPVDGAWVDTLTPFLEVNPAVDFDRDMLTYRFEVYDDASLSNLVAEGVAGNPGWAVLPNLEDNTWYYWRALATDEHGLSGDWSETGFFFTDSNGVNDPPYIEFLTPVQDSYTNSDVLTILWEDSDPDSSALINLYVEEGTWGQDGLLFESGIPEDEDGESDSYIWDISGIDEGTYYLHAEISDGEAVVSGYAAGAVIIDRTPPKVHADPPGGNYESGHSITLFSDEAAQIFFSVNYSGLPNEWQTYTEPLELEGNISLSFFAVDLAGNAGEAVVENYTTDSDHDGMLDSWELEYFGTLDRDGTDDLDGDGLTDLTEYQNGTDPLTSNAPSEPEIGFPVNLSEVTLVSPSLEIVNSVDPDDDPITYDFEVFEDESLTRMVAGEYNIRQTETRTAWIINRELDDNRWYFWRVRAGDGNGYSLWTYGSFFVNTANDAPEIFYVSSPQDRTEVDILSPTLQVTNSSDVDGDVLTYSFNVFQDADLIVAVASISELGQGGHGATNWKVDATLDDNSWYFWTVSAADEHGAITEIGPSAFFVNTMNDAPSAPQIFSPSIDSESETLNPELVVRNAYDIDEDVLTYLFEIDTLETFDGDDLMVSDELFEGDGLTGWPLEGLNDNTRYYWRVRASDGLADSPWARGRFFVNTENDRPSVPVIRNPGQGAWVDTLTPSFEAGRSTDPDMDRLLYRFEIRPCDPISGFVAEEITDTPRYVIFDPLSDNIWYTWRVRAEDEHGAASKWTEDAWFFTDSNGVNDPPAIDLLTPLEDAFISSDRFDVRWEDADPDNDAVISLYYDQLFSFNNAGLIQDGLSEDPDEEGDTWVWDLSGLAEGTYRIHSKIADGNKTAESMSPGTVTVDRTPASVSADPEGGMFWVEQRVTLTADEPAEIYYTLDGTEPTEEALLYNRPVDLFCPVTLKAMAIDRAGNRSGTVVAYYAITIVKGDLDFDGNVDRFDRKILLDALHICETSDGFLPKADFDGDGCLTTDDLHMWQKYYKYFDVNRKYLESLKGDLDGDDDVDTDDRAILKTAMDACEGDSGFIQEADYNANGCIDKKDLIQWTTYFGNFQGTNHLLQKLSEEIGGGE